MSYSTKVREILQLAKKAATVINPSGISEMARVLDWEAVAAAACAEQSITPVLADLLQCKKPDLIWPQSTAQTAAKLADHPSVETPLRLSIQMDELLRKVKAGRDVCELEDLARMIWDGARQQWRDEFLAANSLPSAAATIRLIGKPAEAPPEDLTNLLRRLFDQITAFTETLHTEVVGQDRALEEISKALLQGGLVHSRGPRAVLLFVGPPGCGKTHAAMVLGEKVFEGKYKRFDMSAYSDSQSGVEGLIGIPPFYHGGKDHPGELTTYVAKNPEALLVFDEIEKANPAVIRLFLQILDAGHLEDKARERKVSFAKATIVFTTNAGKTLYEDPNRVGMLSDAPHMYRDTILEALEQEQDLYGRTLFPKEICSRLAGGYPVLFRPLEPLDYERILDLEWPRFNEGLLGRAGAPVGCDDPVVKALLVLHSGPDLDARRVRQVAQRFVTESVLSALRGTAYPEVLESLLARQVDRIELRLSPADEGEITRQIQEGGRCILLVDDEQEAFVSLFSSFFPEYTWHGAGDIESARDVLKTRKIDWVLQDLDLKGKDPAEMEVDSGIHCLSVLHKQWPALPIYIFSRALRSDSFDQELFNRCVNAGGARGFLDKIFTQASQTIEAETFKSQLDQIRSNLAREAVVRRMLRSRKRVVFDVAPRLHGPTRSIHCNIHNVRYETVPTSGGHAQFEVQRPNIGFSSVAGNEPALRELRLIVQGLRDPDRFGRLGAPLPRGVLLTGPPGTGKTLLARAVAGEADVPFIAAKASEFTTSYQASGATAIRTMFANARKHAPMILFIDEIDAVAPSRDGLHGSSNEYRQSLTQLLAEMDGFHAASDSPPVIVLAATNRAGDLDPALKRPGRFDRIVEVGLPELNAREQILRLHARNKAIGQVNWRRLAQRTRDCSGAELERIIHEALCLATQADKDHAGEAEINEALTRLRMGDAREGTGTEFDRRLVAAHEAGHALATKALLPDRTISQVTIIGRGSRGGFTEQSETEAANQLLGKRAWENELCILMAGRAAEEILCNEITPGALSDIKSATAIAYDMVARWGLSRENGLLSIDGIAGTVSEQRRAAIETDVQSLLDDCARRARELIQENKELVAGFQALLMDKETLLEDDIAAFWQEHGLPCADAGSDRPRPSRGGNEN